MIKRIVVPLVRRMCTQCDLWIPYDNYCRCCGNIPVFVPSGEEIHFECECGENTLGENGWAFCPNCGKPWKLEEVR